MIRDFKTEDFRAIQTFHVESGIDYQMPNLGGPLVPVKKICELDGELVGAMALRVCPETFLWLEKRRRPQEKMQIMSELQTAVLREAWVNGLDEIWAAIPPIGFDKRLKQLGWEPDRNGWRLWTRRTG